MTNGKRKGSRGERELRDEFNIAGFPCHRSQQFCGRAGDADITFEDPDLNSCLHVECKRVEQLNLWRAILQSEKDAKPGQIPIVCHKKNRTGWVVSMAFDQWVELWRQYWELTNE